MRLTKIITRNGDQGKTKLAQGDSVYKNELIINAIGDIDELNSVLGVCISSCNDENIINEIQNIQNDLFNIGGEISLNDSSKNLLKDDSLSFLDNRIKELNASLEPLEEFILPGGNSFSSNLHLARAIARRSERSIVDLYIKDLENNNIVKYLNRLSDYLFVLSRFYNKKNNIDENMWKK
ncbi:MAG: cob(I)yrinic acid a,c-diamide adenosyltransferase [Candidatus Neomarinimicrobiota bacterium]|nr:cob(I)yrinic acid a,c-diamide adenosyltransferase [Candidatus Neomarinimicrobiota bacterium]